MNSHRIIRVGDIIIGGEKSRFVLFAGPCVIENENLLHNIAKEIKNITDRVSIPFVFKCSYDKANRLSIDSYRGPGLKDGLRIISGLKEEIGVPVVVDVHLPDEVEYVAELADIIQIPAFLCRQTDLVVEAAKTKKPLHIKKGQFMAPEDMFYIAEKALKQGNENIILCERGTTFGYHNLVIDFRSIPIMKGFGFPVSIDATHSLQHPGSARGYSGGNNEFIEYVAMAGLVFGADVVFLETHPQPQTAPSDAAVMLPLSRLEPLLVKLKKIQKQVKNNYKGGC